MSYLLDTCVISEATNPRPAAAVTAWLSEVDPDDLYLSVLTLGELERGIERLADGRRKRDFRTWLERVRAESVDRIVAVDDATATEWGRILA